MDIDVGMDVAIDMVVVVVGDIDVAAVVDAGIDVVAIAIPRYRCCGFTYGYGYGDSYSNC